MSFRSPSPRHVRSDPATKQIQ
jgi:hypothetical protein